MISLLSHLANLVAQSKIIHMERKPENKKIPSRILPVSVGIILFCACVLTIVNYLFGNEINDTLQDIPSSTPFLNADGSTAYIHSYILDVGNGVCFFAVSPEGKTLLVDTGHDDDFESLSELLKQNYVSSIDILLLTCSDKGHIGGVEKLLSEYPVSVCYMTQHSIDDVKMQPIIGVLNDSNVPYNVAQASFTSTLPWAENAELRILSPYDVVYENEKDYSLMVRLSYGASEILLAGDANKVAERMVIKALPDSLIHSDVLLVSDHGDKDGTGEKFLSSVRPQIAVISCSNNNPPHINTIHNLEVYCQTILRTDKDGPVHIILDGATSKVIE